MRLALDILVQVDTTGVQQGIKIRGDRLLEAPQVKEGKCFFVPVIPRIVVE